MANFRLLEVKDAKLIQAQRQIEKEFKNFKPKKVWSFEEVSSLLESYITKQYDGKYKEFIQRVDKSRGDRICIYYNAGQFSRADIFDEFFDKDNGLFINFFREKVFEQCKVEIDAAVIARFKQLGFVDRNLEYVKAEDQTTENIMNSAKVTFEYKLEEEKKGQGKVKEVKKIAFLTLNPRNVRSFTTTPAFTDKGVKGKEKEGHTSDDTKEIAPILYAYRQAKKLLPIEKINLKSYEEFSKNLGVSAESLEAIDKKYNKFSTSEIPENRKKAKLAEYQGEVIYEIMSLNPAYEIYRGGKDSLYDKIRKKGIDLYKKKFHRGLNVNNYTPADFIMSKITAVPDADSLEEYNEYFTNQLLSGGAINKIKNPTHIFIGISQKMSEEARGGAAGQFFSIVKKDMYPTIEIPKTSEIDIDKLYEDMNKKLLTLPWIKLETMHGSQFISAAKASAESKKTTYEMFKMMENLATGGKGLKKGEIKPEYFLELVEFATAASPNVNPCFYKLIADKLEAYNNERFKMWLNFTKGEQIVVKYSKSAKEILMIIPIFVNIDTGEGFRKQTLYKVKLPFTVTGDGITPNVYRLENLETVTFKETIEDIAGKKQNNSITHLTAMGYGPEEFAELQEIYDTGLPHHWFKRYRELVYDYIMKNLRKVKDEDIRIELRKEVIEELKNIKSLREDSKMAANAYKYILYNLFRNRRSGIRWDDTNKKYIFESINPTERKITEILTKIDEYK